MSTSPSWFDQEKFSRLVKKVGPKAVTGALPSVSAAEQENRPPVQGLASTARISLVSKPPSLLAEHRALPALPRRTTPLPTLKALFSQSPSARYSPAPAQPAPEPTAPTPTEESVPKTAPETPLESKEVQEESVIPPTDTTPDVDTEAPFAQEGEDLAEAWQKMSQLNDELARAVQERDQAISEGVILREQLRLADEAVEKSAATPAQAQELSALTEERDQARREYATLRGQFETLKQEQSPKEEFGKSRKELDQLIQELRQKLEERDREITALKAGAAAGAGTGSGGGAEGGDDKLKQELASLREQLTHAKSEASNAQRGLILSQKALQETRDTLREATEGTSLSRHNFDNLKNECATLAQQNTVLQSQNEQLTRDLAAAKINSTGRL